jgi:hypothetical protein
MIQKLPSIHVPSPFQPVHRIVGAPSRPYPSRVTLRRSEDEQQRMLQQIKQEEEFWKLRLRNRP